MNKIHTKFITIFLLAILPIAGLTGQQWFDAAYQPKYLSPTHMAIHPVTKEVYVLLSTAGSIA